MSQPGASHPGTDVTRLLVQLREGNQNAASQLLPLVYGELRRMAAAYMRNERSGHTLQPTALVNEAYMRLVGADAQCQNRTHFFAIAAHTMRQVLTDYARQRRAEKRGGAAARKVDLDAELLVSTNSLEEVIAIDDLLDRLEQISPRQSRMIELRFFAGLNVEETAEVLDVSTITVHREWRSAKAWLHRELTAAKAATALQSES